MQHHGRTSTCYSQTEFGRNWMKPVLSLADLGVHTLVGDLGLP